MHTPLALLLAACAPDLAPLAEAPPPAALTLQVTSVLPGQPVTWTVTGLSPGETAWVARSAAVSPGGTCPPALGGVCLDLRAPASLLSTATADAQGVATRTMTVPATVPPGGSIVLQAAAIRGQGGVDSVKSGAVTRTIGAYACGDGVLDPGETCDDGGALPGDGCDDACQIEACPTPEIPRSRTRYTATTPGGSPVLSSARRAADGDLMVFGTVEHLHNVDAWVTRMDADTLAPAWTRVISEPHLYAQALAPTPDGGAWVVGRYEVGAYQYDSALAVKLDANGDEALTTRASIYSDTWETIHDAWATPDNGVVIVGSRVHINDSYTDGYVLKLTSTGQVAWTWILLQQVNADTHLDGVRVLANGDILAWGISGEEFSPSHLTVLKFNPNGGLRWRGEMNFDAYEITALDAVELANGDLALFGHKGAYGSPRAWVAVFDPNGVRRWSKTLNATGTSEANALVQEPATCAAATATGDACSVAGQTCANSTPRVCACDGATWTCGADQPTLRVQWTASSTPAPWRETELTFAGAVVQTRSADDAALGAAVGRALVDPRGAATIVTRDSAPRSFDVLRTDAELDWSCPTSVAIDAVVANYTPSWQVSNGGGGSARPDPFRAYSDVFATSAAAADPSGEVVCADSICP